MAVSKKTAAEYAVELETAIKSRNADYDTKIGPIPDLIINPVANVLELQNERVRAVQSLLSLINNGMFTDTDLEDFVYNELVRRSNGSTSVVTLVFSRTSAPTANITVKANFPVSTLADEDTGVALTYLTLVDATMVAANAPAYFNNTTQRYELTVTAQATSAASIANVGPNRIIRALRPLVGFDNVFNRDSAVGGTDTESNDDLISRYYLSLTGTSPAIVDGVDKILRDLYPAVEDSNEVHGSNSLNVRSASDGGAVDVYVIGNSNISVTENIVFSGVGQVIPLTNQPIISISSIVGAGTYVQGTDFLFIKDTSGYANSVRGSDGIRWLATGTIPVIGAVLTVTYVYNSLMQQLQDSFTQSDKDVPGRDILFKDATKINVRLEASIKIRSGFGISTALSVITTAINDLINNLKLHGNVEGSDIQAVVRAFTAVDNFVITKLAKVGGTGTADIVINDNEYARIEPTDLILTVV